MWQWLKALLQRPQPEPEDENSTYPDESLDVFNLDIDCPDTQPTQPGALEP